MRDGVTLRADIYRPAADAPAPVLLMRLPYDKTSAEMIAHTHPLWYSRHGYLVVVQDTRGRFRSEGEFYPFRDEMTDGYDSVEWAAALPGSNGRVGMYGFSYVGATQLLAAVMQPPHLACIAPAFTSSDYYEHWTYPGGALSLAFTGSWATQLATELARRRGDSRREYELQEASFDLAPWYRYLPLRDYPPLRADDLGSYYFDWLAHPTRDEYWKQWSIQDRHHLIRVPCYHTGGWYDVFLEGTLRNYAGIRAHGATEQARQGQRLLIGPWMHMPWSPLVGELDFGREAGNVVDDALLGFFDYWLKDERDALPADDRPVRLFVMGVNDWRAYEDYPPRQAEPVTFYLHSDGRANSLNGDGTLSRTPPGDEPSDMFVHDPRAPVQSVGGHSCCFPYTSPMGPADQRTVEYRNDVLVFSSPPLERELEVIGPVTVTLFAGSSAVDTDWTVKLVDVLPDERAINLCDGILRARYRNGLEKPEPLEPDRVYEYQIPVGSTANVFSARHRIRIEIASSNFPMYDRNPGHGGDIASASYADLRPATQFVFHDAHYPSCLILPVVKS